MLRGFESSSSHVRGLTIGYRAVAVALAATLVVSLTPGADVANAGEVPSHVFSAEDVAPVGPGDGGDAPDTVTIPGDGLDEPRTIALAEESFANDSNAESDLLVDPSPTSVTYEEAEMLVGVDQRGGLVSSIDVATDDEVFAAQYGETNERRWRLGGSTDGLVADVGPQLAFGAGVEIDPVAGLTEQNPSLAFAVTLQQSDPLASAGWAKFRLDTSEFRHAYGGDFDRASTCMRSRSASLRTGTSGVLDRDPPRGERKRRQLHDGRAARRCRRRGVTVAGRSRLRQGGVDPGALRGTVAGLGRDV